MRITDRTIQSDNSLIRITLFEGEGGGNGAVLVIPGFEEPALIYTELARHLTDSGYACAVLNPPFDPDAAGPFYRLSVENIGKTAAAMQERSGKAPLYLYAHSMGANIALRYLLDYSQREFSGVMLEAPWIALHEKPGILKMLFCRMAGLIRPETVIHLHLPEFSEDRINVRLFADLNEGGRYAKRHANRLSLPLFLAVAGRDRVMNNKDTYQFEKKLECPVTLHEYDCAHSIHTEPVRRQLYRDVLEFLGEQSMKL